VLGADERVVEVTCFFLREHKYSAGTVSNRSNNSHPLCGNI